MSDLDLTIGAAIDILYAMRQERYDAQRAVDAMKAKEKELEAVVLRLLNAQDLNQGKGVSAIASVSVDEQPTVVDWNMFYDHVRTTGEFDLLQRRVSSTAIKARWDNEAEVPGIGKFTQPTLSLRKV